MWFEIKNSDKVCEKGSLHYQFKRRIHIYKKKSAKFQSIVALHFPLLSSNRFAARFQRSSLFLTKKFSSSASWPLLSNKPLLCKLYSHARLFARSFSSNTALFLSSAMGTATAFTAKVTVRNHAIIPDKFMAGKMSCGFRLGPVKRWNVMQFCKKVKRDKTWLVK